MPGVADILRRRGAKPGAKALCPVLHGRGPRAEKAAAILSPLGAADVALVPPGAVPARAQAVADAGIAVRDRLLANPLTGRAAARGAA